MARRQAEATKVRGNSLVGVLLQFLRADGVRLYDGFRNVASTTAMAEIVKSINVSDLESAFEAGADVTPELLRTSGVAKGIWHELKILGDGEISKSLSVSAHRFSKQAREKILAAGGSVSEVPGPAALVKGQKKVRNTEQSASP